MPSAFTVLWTMRERQAWLDSGQTVFTSAFGNAYRARGVAPGDSLYILSCGQGSVWLWGRITVRQVEECAASDPSGFRDAVRADRRQSTPADPNRLLPPQIVAGIRFADGQGPAMRENGPDPQTFRGIRRLSDESRAVFEKLLRNNSIQAPHVAQSPDVSEAPDADILAMRALSVRQPYVELILRGVKTVEYRSTPTTVRGRVLLYASRIPGPAEAFSSAKLKPEGLVRGAVVGSVNVVACRVGRDGYEWDLTEPRRLPVPMIPDAKPQPIWFYPFRQG